MSNSPFFSIIIPSRNRPVELAAAVSSVLAQDFSDCEVVIVDDGSTPPVEPGSLLPDNADGKERVRVVNLSFHLRGRGPGYARNVGVWASKGRYVAFLDDDDIWTRQDYLSLAFKAVSAASADVFFANQEAITTEGERRLLWLNALADVLAREKRAQQNECYQVAVGDLISAGGFSHLNTTIVRREFFDQLSGIDEYIRYEEDLDFYLRSIDAAGAILFHPGIVARHHVPDSSRQDNASTLVGKLQKMNTRLYLLNKNRLAARDPAIVQYCQDYSASTLKHMTEYYLTQGDYPSARRWAARALAEKMSAKWALYTVCLWMRSLFR